MWYHVHLNIIIPIVYLIYIITVRGDTAQEATSDSDHAGIRNYVPI